jgi:Fic family protein
VATATKDLSLADLPFRHLREPTQRVDQPHLLEIRAGTLHPRSSALIREAFQMGSIDRGRVPTITGLGERQARSVLSKLIERGVLSSASHRAPVRLLFPGALAERWFPNLYPGLT